MTSGKAFFWVAAAGLLLCGCNHTLPRLRENLLDGRFAPIPKSVTRTHSWQGERGPLFTYWGRQHIRISVRAWLPDNLKNPEDARWEINARNAEGKPLPFLGFLKSHTNENGARLSVLTPPVELDTMPDGLYTALRTEIDIKQDRLQKIVLTAAVIEIRDHTFKPFMVKIPLIPDTPSTLTPIPPELPKPPTGTPVPFNHH